MFWYVVANCFAVRVQYYYLPYAHVWTRDPISKTTEKTSENFT